MAEEPNNLVLTRLREMRADVKTDFARLDVAPHDVHVAALDIRAESLDEKFESTREGTVSAIGYDAHASRAQVGLHKQIAEPARRVERLEAAI